mmetsp:Transcript_20921/g.53078  ORF Transcript_20921/g.53078 Transcript_20921/m.53078 type:complete len:200 (+) Transcript_20921:426-1025(+)
MLVSMAPREKTLACPSSATELGGSAPSSAGLPARIRASSCLRSSNVSGTCDPIVLRSIHRHRCASDVAKGRTSVHQAMQGELPPPPALPLSALAEPAAAPEAAAYSRRFSALPSSCAHLSLFTSRLPRMMCTRPGWRRLSPSSSPATYRSPSPLSHTSPPKTSSQPSRSRSRSCPSRSSTLEVRTYWSKKSRLPSMSVT